MGQTLVTKSPSETQKWSERFAKKLRGGDMVALYGELGSGKTTFVQGLARGLGVKRHIISPTFIIVRKYGMGIMNHESGIKSFYHVDLYRIENKNDLQGLGLEEIMKDKHSIVAIEWAEKVGELLPKTRWDIQFAYVSESRRRVHISHAC